ncbi:DMT family transporter [Neiella sp. HB171785]|uniref:DMT family transporter n=1 Tax=Neiella litorisoli TaxID=2771431 RepID=A0A8J6UPL5_9GAMM|nr:DMT family transporter [Neiella litorisoli]MBD1388772.1 DMT family transporter [Neiella litorisoli]
MRLLFLTLVALIAFAANSVLCRLALGSGIIDASSFTAIRLFSGAVVLALLLSWRASRRECSSERFHPAGSWRAAIYLFVYAAAFSYGYLTLDTGSGALILFGAVQVTMILVTLVDGNKLTAAEWIGVICAFTGFVYLLWPNLELPSLTGFLLMAAAGIAWGLYTLTGRQSEKPLSDTAWNFIRSLPLVMLLAIAALPAAAWSNAGIWLAVASGALASGLGYAIWYQALSQLTATQAAVLQLLVPVLAALGGVLFVDEQISLRLLIASAVVLGGILLVVLSKQQAH